MVLAAPPPARNRSSYPTRKSCSTRTTTWRASRENRPVSSYSRVLLLRARVLFSIDLRGEDVEWISAPKLGKINIVGPPGPLSPRPYGPIRVHARAPKSTCACAKQRRLVIGACENITPNCARARRRCDKRETSACPKYAAGQLCGGGLVLPVTGNRVLPSIMSNTVLTCQTIPISRSRVTRPEYTPAK
jgi:hypothetical protein